jgi:hypothetical protein
MDRDCKNCVYHSSGSCSQWDCNFTTTNDVRNKAVDDFAAAIIPRLSDVIYSQDIVSMTNLINEIAEQLKAGDKNKQIR